MKTVYPLQTKFAGGIKIIQYCTCPAGRVTYNFHSSCKCMHLYFKSVCGVIFNMTSLSNSSQSTRPTRRVLWEEYSSFLDFTGNYKPTSGIFVPCFKIQSQLTFVVKANIHFLQHHSSSGSRISLPPTTGVWQFWWYPETHN